MPELPEVETIKRDLENILKGKILASAEVRDASVLTGIGPSGKPFRDVSPKNFISRISGRKAESFQRKGKYIVMGLGGSSGLIFHLRMTGQLVVRPARGNERILFHFQTGETLCFSDVRRFGEVFYSGNWTREPRLARLGLDPLEKGFDGDFLRKNFKGRSAPAHSLLLNQEIAAGIGNIYAAEALFRAGIHPLKPGGKLTPAEADALASAVRTVLRDSIRHRGYSMNSYLDGLGLKGNTQKFACVYGREGRPCKLCGRRLQKEKNASRGVVFCPACQKKK